MHDGNHHKSTTSVCPIDILMNSKLIPFQKQGQSFGQPNQHDEPKVN
jgi:hypothetical protein